jgi:DNA-binding beta-propeller fold protein YncE
MERGKPPFRDQSLGGIVLSMARALLRPPQARYRAVSAASPQGEEGGTPAPVPSGSAGSRPVALIISVIALLIVIVVSIVVLVRVFASANETPAAITGTGPTSQPTSAVVGTTASLVVPTGVPITPTVLVGNTTSGPAALLAPQEAVQGRDGLIYVADAGNHRVAVFSRAGKLMRSITNGQKGALLAPFSLAFTPAGHLLVLDSDAGQIIEYGANGEVLQATSKALPLMHARGIATDAAGQVYVADPAENAVYTLAPDLSLAHAEPAAVPGAPDRYDQPTAVAVGPNGFLYVVDSQNSRLDEFSSTWSLVRSWPLAITDSQHSPRILPLPDGRIVVSDARDSKLLLYSGAAEQPDGFNLPVTSAVPLQPLGIALHTAQLLITCNGSNQILLATLPAH